MNELHIQETMTSLQIAEVTSKMHKHVLDAIRTMEPAWEKIAGTKFRLSEYTDKSGKKNPCYSLTKTECLYIATKFNDEARAKLILRWKELEQEAVAKALPRSYKEALQALLEEVNKREALEAESQRKSEQLESSTATALEEVNRLLQEIKDLQDEAKRIKLEAEELKQSIIDNKL